MSLLEYYVLIYAVGIGALFLIEWLGQRQLQSERHKMKWITKIGERKWRLRIPVGAIIVAVVLLYWWLR